MWEHAALKLKAFKQVLILPELQAPLWGSQSEDLFSSKTHFGWTRVYMNVYRRWKIFRPEDFCDILSVPSSPFLSRWRQESHQEKQERMSASIQSFCSERFTCWVLDSPRVSLCWNLQRNQKLTWLAQTGTTRDESLSAEQTACLSRYDSNIRALNSDLKNSRSASSIRPFTFALHTAGTGLTTVVSDFKKRRVWIYCAQSSLSSFRDEDLRLSSFLTSQ